jgi:hypothetical protein
MLTFPNEGEWCWALQSRHKHTVMKFLVTADFHQWGHKPGGDKNVVVVYSRVALSGFLTSLIPRSSYCLPKYMMWPIPFSSSLLIFLLYFSHEQVLLLIRNINMNKEACYVLSKYIWRCDMYCFSMATFIMISPTDCRGTCDVYAFAMLSQIRQGE